MAQQIFSCEIVNRELENGFDLEHSLQINGFSPQWLLGGFWDFLIPKMTWNILYKGGEGEFFWKWLLPENGFSLKMASPRKWLLPSKWLLPENGFSSEITSPQEIQNKSHFNLRDSWLLPMWTWSLLLDENVVWQSLHPKYFRFGIILEKQLTPVAKVGFFNILYH